MDKGIGGKETKGKKLRGGGSNFEGDEEVESSY